MNRKQRIHSAELRRLDHIAQSLDRIGVALEHLHEVIVSGDNDIVNMGNNDTVVKNHSMFSKADHGSASAGNDSTASVYT